MTTLPKNLLFEVTARCNFRCGFCYCVWHEYPELAQPELDTKGWKEIISECAKRGVNDITFTGGEATLRDDLWHLMEFARKQIPAARLSLFTNGSLMTEERILFCKNWRINLNTSLQGLRTYGRQTGTRRTYKRVLSFIARAAELEWPVNVSITANKLNLSEIEDTYAAAVLSHAAYIQLNPTMVEGRLRNHPEAALTKDEWETLKKRIEKLPSGGVPKCFSDEMICDCRFQPDNLKRTFGGNGGHSCSAGKTFGVIGPSGLFRKCLHTVENLEWR